MIGVKLTSSIPLAQLACLLLTVIANEAAPIALSEGIDISSTTGTLKALTAISPQMYKRSPPPSATPVPKETMEAKIARKAEKERVQRKRQRSEQEYEQRTSAQFETLYRQGQLRRMSRPSIYQDGKVTQKWLERNFILRHNHYNGMIRQVRHYHQKIKAKSDDPKVAAKAQKTKDFWQQRAFNAAPSTRRFMKDMEEFEEASPGRKVPDRFGYRIGRVPGKRLSKAPQKNDQRRVQKPGDELHAGLNTDLHKRAITPEQQKSFVNRVTNKVDEHTALAASLYGPIGRKSNAKRVNHNDMRAKWVHRESVIDKNDVAGIEGEAGYYAEREEFSHDPEQKKKLAHKKDLWLNQLEVAKEATKSDHIFPTEESKAQREATIQGHKDYIGFKANYHGQMMKDVPNAISMKENGSYKNLATQKEKWKQREDFINKKDHDGIVKQLRRYREKGLKANTKSQRQKAEHNVDMWQEHLKTASVFGPESPPKKGMMSLWKRVDTDSDSQQKVLASGRKRAASSTFSIVSKDRKL